MCPCLNGEKAVFSAEIPLDLWPSPNDEGSEWDSDHVPPFGVGVTALVTESGAFAYADSSRAALS